MYNEDMIRVSWTTIFKQDKEVSKQYTRLPRIIKVHSYKSNFWMITKLPR